MSTIYQKLVLDPRCLRPAREVNDRYVYIDALDAISCALDQPNITESEKNILEVTKKEVRRNRFAK
jgi:hypothetical protein